MTHYQKILIKITLKYGINEKEIPTKFKDEICKSVNELFPNWNFIEYLFEN